MRVYFLGAGASKSIYPGPPKKSKPGLPTAKELKLNHLLDVDHYEDREAPRDEIMRLKSFVQLGKIDPHLLDMQIEDVLHYFESNEEQDLCFRICLVSRLQIDDKEDTGPLRQWLECVQKAGNALLTTNYDMVLERGIRKLTKSLDSRPSKDRGLVDYGVEPELLFPGYRGVARNASPNSILLLKLHGSISWGYCKACKKAKLDPAYRGLAEDTLAGAARCLGPECSALLSPILVGPAKKRYDHPVIESIFTSAKEALERADEIVFAGFSLSSGDEKIGELLRKAHEIAHTTRVTIIDPKASELASRFEAIYGAGVEYTLENDWLEYLRGPSY